MVFLLSLEGFGGNLKLKENFKFSDLNHRRALKFYAPACASINGKNMLV